MTQSDIIAWLSTLTVSIFPIFAHVILWLGLLGTFIVIQQAIWGATGLERLVRVVSFLSAPLILLAAKSFGMSMPDFLFRSISLTNPIGLGLFGFLLPGALGVLTAWFFIRSLDRSSYVTVRVMILVSTFILFQFGQIYAAALVERHGALDENLAPNFTFTIGLFLYVVFNYRPGRGEL